MIIYHIAVASDWERATAAGDYRISTRGRTLAEEGFIHCSYADQVAGVARAFYRDVDEPLVVLSVDTALLDSQVVAESPAQPGAAPIGDAVELFPHVYGPIPVGAVVSVDPLVLPEA